MSREQRKYIREQEILRDKEQLNIDTLTPMKNFLKPRLNLNGEQNVICPFCLYRDKLIKFRFTVKSGYHRSLGKCPECKQHSQLRTLISIPNMNPKQFASWVFEYGAEYWKKCIFDTFKIRLYCDRDFCTRFWEEYKKLKGDYDE